MRRSHFITVDAPSFASYFPEAALEDFNRSLRNQPDLAMILLNERALSLGRELFVLSAGEPWFVGDAETAPSEVGCPVNHAGLYCSLALGHLGPHLSFR